MQLLNQSELSVISGGETYAGLTKANWATVFGLTAKMGADTAMNVFVAAHPNTIKGYQKVIAYMLSSALGLYVGFSSLNTLDAMFSEDQKAA